MEVPQRFVAFFRAFLRDRKYHVRVGLSRTRSPVRFATGVPQGSVCGPILYLIFSNSLLTRLADLANTGLQHAAHADDDETHRSTVGWFFFLRKGKGAVAAKSGQTKDIPLSSTESETIWGSNAAMQGAFLKQFLDETRLFRTATFEMHEDSQPMINAQKRNVSQSRFKHMRTKHHYIRKLLFDGWCKLVKIPTKMNTADMATKILPASTISVFSKIVLGLQDTLQCATDTGFSAMLT